MSTNPRFSIVTTQTHDGTWTVHVTDYKTRRSEKRFLFPSRRAAHAEGKQLVTHWQYGSLPTTNERGVA